MDKKATDKKKEVTEKDKEKTEESRYYEYSTRIFDSCNEMPKIKLKELLVDDGKNNKNKKERKIALILNYKINGKEQNVIIATANQFKDRTAKSRVIIDYITAQFEENFKGKPGFENIEKLYQFTHRDEKEDEKVKKKIPIEFTSEGIDIILEKGKNNIIIPKTVVYDDEEKMKYFLSKEDAEQMKTIKQNVLDRYIEKEKNEREWTERREKILESLDDKRKERFLNGEKITHFIEKNKKNQNVKREYAEVFLLEQLEKKQKQLGSLISDYAQLKEKAFAINIKVVLEKQRDRCFAKIKEESKKNAEADKNKINAFTKLKDRIENYLELFELIKQKEKWNASYTYEDKDMNMEDVKVICKAYDPDDKEILQYLDLKKETINNDKFYSEDKENNYIYSGPNKNLYKFLIKSNVKDYTTPDVYSAKNVVENKVNTISESIYAHIEREILYYNKDDIMFYNKYAKGSKGVKYYEIKEEEINKYRKESISDLVKKFSEKITAEKSIEQKLQNNLSDKKIPTNPENPGDTER